MTSKQWVTILTISGSVILFGAWLNENYVEKQLNERLNIIKDFSQKLALAKIENGIMETKIWNVRNLFIKDTTNTDLKKTFYDNIIEYHLANLKSSEIANEGHEALYPTDTATVNDGFRNLVSLKISFKAMLDEDSSSSKKIDENFMRLVARGFFPSIYNSDIFEGMYNMNHQYDYELNLAYIYRIWLYIIGSFFLAIAYTIQRRDEH